MTSTASTALVYARFSNDKTDQKISVDRQVKLCTARAADLWPAAEVKVFRDDSISGSDPTAHRPGFEQFLGAVRSARKGEIVGVVVNEQSRLTRQGTNAWDDLVVTLTKAGITKVDTLRQGPISVQPGSRLVGRMLAVVDAEESERTKARVQDAHRDMFTEGRPSGRPPYGYRMTKECPGAPTCPGGDDGRPHFEIDPVQGPVVEDIFEMARKGQTVASIVDHLNAAGVAPKAASFTFKKQPRKVTAWTPNAVRNLLTCATLAGLRSHVDEHGVQHTTPGRWQAIIDLDDWHEVQRLLGQPRKVTRSDGQTYTVPGKATGTPRKYLLSGGRRQGESYGVLRCGKCGNPLVAQTQARRNGPRISGYACAAKTAPGACAGVSISPAETVEDLVVEVVKARLTASSKVRQRLDATDDTEVAQWRAERDAAKAEMLQAAEMKASREIDLDQFRLLNTAAKAAHEHAEARLSAMETSTTLPSAADVLHRWDSLTLRQQRAVVERLVESITVAPAGRGHRGFDPARLGVPVWRA